MTQIDYYYSAHSAYAYLGAARLYKICAKHDAILVHRPIALSPVVAQQGSLPFVQRTQAHVDYFFGREIERWAEWRGVEITPMRPTWHDADYSLANGVIEALGPSGAQIDAVSLALLRAHWVDDLDLSNVSGLAAVLTSLGIDAQRILAMAASNDIQARLAAHTQAAQDLSLFGSPCYVLDGEVFYGQDRLEMVERAINRPFAASQWRNPPVDPAR